MPYRDRAQVQQWLSDFWDTHDLFNHKISVVDDGFVPTPNSGIVVATLSPSDSVAYLSVRVVDAHPTWTVTFEPRTTEVNLTGLGVAELSREIGAIGILCEYLQARTDDAVRRGRA